MAGLWKYALLRVNMWAYEYIFLDLQPTEASRVLIHYLYSITVQSAAPQNTLWGGPSRESNPEQVI